MKKLHFQTDLPVDPATAWEVFESQEFRDRLEAETGNKATVLEQTREGHTTITRLRYDTRFELPRVAAKLVGSSNLSYEQINSLDHEAGTLTWQAIIPGLGDRMQVEGVTTMVPKGDGSTRTVDGSISVSVPLVGGQIEKLVASGFGKSIGQAADIALEIIRERGLAG